MNIVICVKKEIVEKGLSMIINDHLNVSDIKCVDRSYLSKDIKKLNHPIAILEIKREDKAFIKLLVNLMEIKKDIKVIIFSERSIDKYILKIIQHYQFGLILDTYSDNKIIEIIEQTHTAPENNTTRFIPVEPIKRIKNNNLSLSNREFEIGQLLITGETTTSISKKSKLAVSTISTYKKRLYQKTNSSNLIQLANFFKKKNKTAEK
jgi:two-component system response regulator FimZ (fimbrial Z protein)